MLSYLFLYLIIALEIYNWIFFLYIIISWFPINENDPIIGKVWRFLSALCEPVYNRVMQFLPPLRIGFMDFSPLYIFLLIYLLRLLLSRAMIWFSIL